MISRADEDIMRDVRDGNLQLLGQLFERYQMPLLNFFLRMSGDRALSEDLVQDVFFRILKFRQTYRGDTPFTTWMYQIARNARVDHFRKRKPESATNEEMASSADTRPSPAEQFQTTEQEELLRRAMARLPEDRRELLILTRYQNLKYEQIAALLDCQTGTVKTRVFRAMQELKQAYLELAGAGRVAAAGQPGIPEAQQQWRRSVNKSRRCCPTIGPAASTRIRRV